MAAGKFKSIVFLIFLIPTICISQEDWSLEFRPGINFPLQDFGDLNTNTGFGFEVTGAYKLLPYLGIYTGWGWNQFKAEEKETNSDEIDFEEMGFTAGLLFIHPLRTSSSISYVIRGGTIYEKIKSSNSSEDFNAESDYEFGWQISGGISYIFGENWFLQPEIRYRSVSSNLDQYSLSNDNKLDYISFGIGLGVEW